MYLDLLETVLESITRGLDDLECAILREMRRHYRRGLEDVLIEVVNLNVNANALLDEVYQERDNQWFLAQV